MTEDVFLSLKNWFHSYVQSFYSTDRQLQFHIRLKEKHTLRVMANAVRIAAWLSCTPEETQQIRIAALLHDVGRFQQYQTYKTFNDALSANHAQLGLEILNQSGCMPAAGLNEKGQEIVRKAILYHNRRQLPGDGKEDWLIPAKVVRDADKIDIFSMLVTTDKENQISLPPELSRENLYSAKIIEDILQGRLVQYSDIKTGNDLLLFRLSWIYDIYFACSFSYILEQGYINKLMESLPGGKDFARVHQCLCRYARLHSTSQ